jgi:hypothetical protein
MLERTQERAAGVDRVVPTAGLEREEQPEVRMFRCRLARLSREPPGLRETTAERRA